MLLTEFESGRAVIEPTDKGIRCGGEVCETMIFSFNGEIVDRVRQMPEQGSCRLQTLNGRHPWYILERDDCKLGVMLAVIGAPMAVGHLEELKACGFENFIVLGSCGVLDEPLVADKIILPSSALSG